MDYEPPASTTLKIGAPDNQLCQDLSQLWELEKTPETSSSLPPEDDYVKHFEETHTTNAEGRYSVQLPRIANPPDLGVSRNLAIQRFLSNEKSLQRKGKLEEFQKALQEYLTLGHAEIVPSDQLTLDNY